MLNEQTIKQLTEMKMYGLLSALQEYLDGYQEGEQLSFADRFGLMVDREWTERQDRALKRRISVAKLRELACVEDIDFRHPRQLNRSVVDALSTCRWIEHHQNLVITGPTGIGKTWLACAFAHQACRQGYTVFYKRIPKLMRELNRARGDGSLSKELLKLSRAKLLIIDDWGLAPLGDQERRDMLEILEDRHGNNSTVFASQLPIELWHDNIGDPTIADALMDRLIHSSHKLELDGESLRKKYRTPQ